MTLHLLKFNWIMIFNWYHKRTTVCVVVLSKMGAIHSCLGAIHKRRRNFFGCFWYPPPPCRNFDPDLPNFHLLISCNIGIWNLPRPSPLKYSDVIYGWPLRRMTKDDDGSSFKRLGSSSIITAIWVLAGRNVGMYLILVGLRIGLDSWRVRKYSTKIFILSKCREPWPEHIYNSHYGNGVPAMFTS